MRNNEPRPISKKPKKRSTMLPRFKQLSNNYVSRRPPFIRTQVCYHEFGLSINPVIASDGVYVFAANGLFDPNITGTGHQPLGFDQYMALYNEYIVFGSTIKVIVQNSNTVCAIAGIFLEDYGTTDTNMSKYIENGNGHYLVLGAKDSGEDVKTLTHRADVKKFSTQDVLASDAFTGYSTANPTDTHFYHVVIAPLDASTDLGACNFSVEIRYDVLFRDPALTALS